MEPARRTATSQKENKNGVGLHIDAINGTKVINCFCYKYGSAQSASQRAPFIILPINNDIILSARTKTK